MKNKRGEERVDFERVVALWDEGKVDYVAVVEGEEQQQPVDDDSSAKQHSSTISNEENESDLQRWYQEVVLVKNQI